mgnify:FL=1
MQLFHGDCLEVMKTLPDQSVDLILTDPPYGTTACKWDSVIPFEPMWNELKRIIKDNGCIALFGSEPFSSALRMSNIKQFKYDWVWNKKFGNNYFNAKYRPMNNLEIISIFYKGVANYFPQMIKRDKPIKQGKNAYSETLHNVGYIRYQDEQKKIYNTKYPLSNLEFSSRINKSEKTLHPTQKPVALLEYLIKTYTNENDTVLDFTMGSGSTGVAAKNLNREFIGIELDQEYYKLSKNRIEAKDLLI